MKNYILMVLSIICLISNGSISGQILADIESKDQVKYCFKKQVVNLSREIY